jgi:CubicO group peptidase (beta-lactamase class C family)
MIPAPPPFVVAAAALPPIPAELVVALQKQMKVGKAVTVVGRLVGTEASFNALTTEGGARADEHTLYPIDGITEAITGVLLADAVRRGEVRLDEPVSELHDADFHPPARHGVPLTLADLATHRAGFAALPLRNAAQPYAAIDRAALMKLVNDTQPAADTASAPSVVDFALLGTLLADRAATSFAGLARERIFVPLNMDDSVGDTGSDRRIPRERSVADEAAGPWQYAALSPAGGVRSTALDMLLFGAAMFAGENGPLAVDMQSAAAPRATTGDGSIGLGWRVAPSGAVWVSGASFGSAAFLGVLPKAHTTVVILTNVGLGFGTSSLDAIGLRLLNATAPAYSAPS